MEEPRWPQWEAQREAERAEQAEREAQPVAEWEALLQGRPEAPRPPKKSDAETIFIELLKWAAEAFLWLIFFIVLGAMALFLILYPIVWLARLFT